MKKYVAFILALVLCLSLCACATVEPTANGETKEALLAKAEKIDTYALSKALDENIVKAEAEYKGKTVLLTGYISKLDKEGITLCTWLGDDFRVNLAQEDITQLYVNQFVDVVGVLTQIDGGLVVDNAYFVNDTYTISGTVVFGYYNISGRIAGVNDMENSACFGDSDAWEFWLQDTEDNYNYNLNLGFGSNIEHKYGQRIDSIDYHGVTLYKGDKITITTKMKKGVGTDGRVLCDVISVEKNSNENGDTIDTTTNPLTFRTITLDDEATANNILELWRAGEATDASMKEIMDEYGADQGGGLLYELDNPENYIQEIASWCLDNSRSAGDATVIKTEYGYAVVYIVSIGNS